MKNEFDLFTGSDWTTVDREYLDEIPNKDAIDELELTGPNNDLKVTWNTGRQVYYRNVYGTWGDPIEFC